MSLPGRLVKLLSESVPLEDLFTEALARLLERRPDLCIVWLEEMPQPSDAPSPSCPIYCNRAGRNRLQ